MSANSQTRKTNTDVNIFIARQMEDQHLAKIQAVSSRLKISIFPCNNPSDMLPYLHGAEIILSYYASFRLEEAPDLQWIQITSAGVDYLRDEPIWDSKVAITNSHIYAIPIAEYVLGSMLSFTRRFPHIHVEFLMQHTWPANPWKRYADQTRELYGSTLGIIGFGEVGKAISQRALAFNMRIFAADLNIHSHIEKDGIAFFPAEQISYLLSESDFIVLCLPLTSSTIGMIGLEELKIMRNNAYLINISRGEIIDEVALIRALKEGWIAGAGLDVFATEPLPSESELYNLKNVIMTPHIAGVSPVANDRVTELFCENLRRYLNAEPLINVVNRSLGY